MYAAKRYRSNETNTASKGTLLVMLYDGITKFLRQSKSGFETGDRAAAHAAMGRALDIVAYLQATLNEDVDPVIVEALDQTYVSWTAVLAKASAEADVEKIESVVTQVDELRAAWSVAKSQVDGGNG